MLAAKTQGVAPQSDMWYCTPRPAKKFRARRRSGRANRRLRRAPRVSTAARARSAGGPHPNRTEPAARSRPICPWRRGRPSAAHETLRSRARASRVLGATDFREREPRCGVLDDVGHVGRALEGFEVVMCCDIGAPELVFDQLLPNDLLRCCSQRFARTDHRRCVPSGGRHHRAPARSSTRSSATARRPDTRRSASAETGGWTPRPFATTSGPRSRFVRPFRPSTVPTTAAGRRSASESALRRP